MWLCFLYAAWSAPPEGVDPDDIGLWEARAAQALKGPAGCWAFEGRLTITGALHTPATPFSRSDALKVVAKGPWKGRIDDGQWTSFAYDIDESEGEVMLRDDKTGAISVPVLPVLGTIDQSVVQGPPPPEDAPPSEITVSVGDNEDGSSRAINLMHAMIDAWDPDSSVSSAEWREAERAIVLTQETPTGPGARAETVAIKTTFPEGGEGASRVETIFPKQLSVGDWPTKLKLSGMQFHLRQQTVGAHTLPAVEGFSVVAGFFGFTFSWDQQISYATARRCPSEG